MRQVFHVPLLLKVSCLLDSEAVFVKSFAKPPLYVFKPVREPNISPFGLALIKYLVQKGKETFKVSKLNTKSQPTTKSTLWLIISITLSKVSHLDPPQNNEMDSSLSSQLFPSIFVWFNETTLGTSVRIARLTIFDR